MADPNVISPIVQYTAGAGFAVWLVRQASEIFLKWKANGKSNGKKTSCLDRPDVIIALKEANRHNEDMEKHCREAEKQTTILENILKSNEAQQEILGRIDRRSQRLPSGNAGV